MGVPGSIDLARSLASKGHVNTMSCVFMAYSMFRPYRKTKTNSATLITITDTHMSLARIYALPAAAFEDWEDLPSMRMLKYLGNRTFSFKMSTMPCRK